MARRAAALAFLLGLEVAAVVVLHQLGRVDGLGGPGGDPVAWLRSASPEEVVASGSRLVALGGAWWLLASTCLYVAARATQWPIGVRAAGLAVLPSIRHRVDRVLAVSVLGASVVTMGATPAAAGEPPPASVTVRSGRAVPAVAPVPAPTPPPEPAPPPATAPASVTFVVQPGDNLWAISGDHLARATGRDAASLSNADVAGYWAQVIEVNRRKLRSDDPDVIYPGEVLDLPPVS